MRKKNNNKKKREQISPFDQLIKGIYANKEFKYKVSGAIILAGTCFMIYHTATSWYTLAMEQLAPS